MKNVPDFTLRAIDHARSKLGPISSLLGKLVESVVPAVTASACGRVYCGPAKWMQFKHYAQTASDCRIGRYNCLVQVCGGC